MRSDYARELARRRMAAERARPGPDLAERLERVGAEVGEYPPEWPVVARLVKTLAGWCCERCGHPNAPTPWVLTVHHLDGDKQNLNDWNLAALCQRCHLRVQGRVIFYQDWPFEHSPWMARHVEGYNEWARTQPCPAGCDNGTDYSRAYEAEHHPDCDGSCEQCPVQRGPEPCAACGGSGHRPLLSMAGVDATRNYEAEWPDGSSKL